MNKIKILNLINIAFKWVQEVESHFRGTKWDLVFLTWDQDPRYSIKIPSRLNILSLIGILMLNILIPKILGLIFKP